MIQKNNKGFTLVEMIVTMVILSVMLATSVMGLMAWQDWSDFNRENEYAETLFIAAQNQLAEFSADGRLIEMQESLSGANSGKENISGYVYDAVGLNLTGSISALVDSDGVAYDMQTLFPESAEKSEPGMYQDEIISLRAEAGEYQTYLNNPEGLKASNPEAYWLFELVGAYVYDSSILNGAGNGVGASICIEITPDDGQVFSVLYSDKQNKFIYLGIPEDKNGHEEESYVADISNRMESYRKERMIGYYGVDTLYKATSNTMIQPALASVKLYNKDTFYMTFKLTQKYKLLTSQLDYEIELNGSTNSKAKNYKTLSLTLDGAGLRNKDNAETILCPVSKYDSNGDPVEIGYFPVLAWVEPDYTVHVVLDAADVQAVTSVYNQDLAIIRAGTAAPQTVDGTASSQFVNTLSFFRFGVEADNVYASVTAKAEGYTTSKTIHNFNNINLTKNQNAKHPVFAGESEKTVDGKTDFTFNVNNARHLYNIRYIEDISYEKDAGDVLLADSIKSVTFDIKTDIDWNKFQNDGQFFNSYADSGILNLSDLSGKVVDQAGEVITNVNTRNCDFPSFSMLRERDVIKGNGKVISGLKCSELSNALYGLYDEQKDNKIVKAELRPLAMINTSCGTIKDLKLDKFQMFGANIVGGFCGINAGTVTNLETKNTGNLSLVSGQKNVGGIMGFQMPTQKEVEFKGITIKGLVIEGLVNRANVEGVEAVGGIMGMVRNDYTGIIDISKLHGLSLDTKSYLANQLANNGDDLKVLVQKCENYGGVAGVNSSELKSIYQGGSTNEDPTEARYIGGIAGYCYNKDKADIDFAYTERIRIEQCVSSPQYDDAKLLSILTNKTELNKKLKGVYVGGIVGYNYYCQINDCSTKPENDKYGYMFGYRYVGGIVGYNIGPASGILGTTSDSQGTNNNHVVAYEYAGGITGCNANTRKVDSENHNLSVIGAKDPEKLEGLLIPEQTRALDVKIDNWLNKGVIIAVNEYSGGITGYNAGYIYRCNSDVEANVVDTYFDALYSGSFAGGIAGYNNGIIGNSEREIATNGRDSKVVDTRELKDRMFSTICYVKGHDYVGGIVGYNDVDSIVEDYEIASGYVLGDEGSCFVGGYAGLNASINLLMNTESATPEGRFIYSNPNQVQGSYFVGGNIGANIINTNEINVTQPTNPVNPTDPVIPDQPTDKVYAKMVLDNGAHLQVGKWVNVVINIYNGTGKELTDWIVHVDDKCKIEGSWNIDYNSSEKAFTASANYLENISANANPLAANGFNVNVNSVDVLKNLTLWLNSTWSVSYSYKDENGMTHYVDNSGVDLNTADENPYGCDIRIQYDGGGHGAQLYADLSNLSGTDVNDWRVEVALDSNISSFDGYNARTDTSKLNENIMIFYAPSDNNQTLTGSGISFQGRVNYHDANAAKNAKIISIKLYSGNTLLYSSDNGNTPVNPPVNPPTFTGTDILAQFKTDNFLGVLNGSEFVGGFVGYNLLFDDSNEAAWVLADEDGYRGAVYVLQKKMVTAVDGSHKLYGNTENGLVSRKEMVDNLEGKIGVKLTPSNYRVVVSGKDAESTTTAFGTISGDIYVGGVMGYNDNNTKLLIRNVENATPVTAAQAVHYLPEQIADATKTDDSKYRRTNYVGEPMDYTYSYVGGIIGAVSEKAELNNCWNSYSGTVITKGTYLGGLCEINEGRVTNCNIAGFGSGVDDYLGGLCGLNKKNGTIDNCYYKDATVSGRNVVGGVAAENFGTIKNITIENPILNASGIATESRDGVAGLFAGVNGDTGSISVEVDLANVNVKSDGRFVGAVVGVNEGTIKNEKVSESGTENNLTISGNIEGYYAVGSLIGLNRDKDNSHVIENYTNKAYIIASNGNAGGIIGENASDNTIQYCVNDSVVSATVGNAGGITSENYGLITNCYDYKSVFAPKGMCGGIVAINGDDAHIDAVIRDCVIEPNETMILGVAFESTQAVGGVAAQNYGEILDNTLKRVIVSNSGTALHASIGVVVGDNMATGRVYMKGGTMNVTESVATAKTNNCNVGGIAGTNAGVIANKKSYEAGNSDVSAGGDGYALVGTDIKFDGATYGSLGGVAGNNTGTIAYCQVDATVTGVLGTATSGYGGVAGYSGFATEKEYEAERQLRKEKNIDDDYQVRIIGCTFDGKVSAPGSAGNLANVGGITGVNAYGGYISGCLLGVRDDNFSSVEEKTTSITSGDMTKTVASPDYAANANVGGIAGRNYAMITDIDMYGKSTDFIEIIGFTGSIGGMVGYQDEEGWLTGYKDTNEKEHWMTTPENMRVEMRRGENDFGVGGIIGYCRSGKPVEYIRNYANVANYVNLNVKTGGIFGTIEQQAIPYVEISNCENYGYIEGLKQIGGIIGRTKFCSVRMTDCINYGDVYASNGSAGGFISRIYDIKDSDVYFTNCINHGKVSVVSNSSNYAGGILGNLDSSTNIFVYFYDCDNTGIVEKVGATVPSTNIGSFVGTGSTGVWYFENCQNHNTAASNNGYIGASPGKIKMNNCLDNSNTQTNQAIVSPFAPANITSSKNALTNSSFENVYYLNSNSKKDGPDFVRNAGAYFTFDRRINYDFWSKGYNFKVVNNPEYYLESPSPSYLLYHGNGVKEYELHVSYDKTKCKGIDQFNIYLWNGEFNDKDPKAINYSFDVTFVDKNGNSDTVNRTATSVSKIMEENILRFDVSDALDSEIVDIIVKSNAGGEVWYHGFSYVPILADNSVGKEAQCTYLAEKYDTTFHMANITKNGTAFTRNSTNGMPTGRSTNDWDDFFGLSLDKYQRYQFNKASATTSLDFTFDVNNGTNATGMKSFVFYPANDNTKDTTLPKDIRTYYYGYKVTFTDVNGDKGSVEVVLNKDDYVNTSAIGYDSSDARFKQPIIVDVPEGLDSLITQVELSINDIAYTKTDPSTNKVTYSANQTNFYCKGFGWIPVGETQIEYMAVGPRPAVQMEKVEASSSVTQLYCDYTNRGTADVPYVYSSGNYDYGFNMSSNDPVIDTYYNDSSVYADSKAQVDGSDSRIRVYEDLHKNFTRFIQEQYTTNYKLNTPKLSVAENYGRYVVTWDKVPDAYSYEVKYDVRDTNGEVVFESKIYEQGMGNTTFKVLVDSDWEGYRVTFYVRAVNGYRYTGNDATDIYRYDSDWGTSEKSVAIVLPQPETHLEITAGNRFVVVLDNYDDYLKSNGSYMDCNIEVRYDYSTAVTNTFIIDVAKGYVSENAIKLEGFSQDSDYTMIAKALPKEETEDVYIPSNQYILRGHLVDNALLNKLDQYVPTTFRGFYGFDANQMTYDIYYASPNNRDCYVNADVISYDEQVGCEVAYSTMNTHVAATSGASNFTATLSDLPMEWFSEKYNHPIIVREYLESSQFHIVHYEHVVAEDVYLDGATPADNALILKGIEDKYYLADDGDKIADYNVSIWDDATNSLKPGYVLRLKYDETGNRMFDIYYNGTIELGLKEAERLNASIPDGQAKYVYGKNCVDYKFYDVNKHDVSLVDAGSTELTTNVSSASIAMKEDYQEYYLLRNFKDGTQLANSYPAFNASGANIYYKLQEIQPAPIIDEDYQENTVDGHRSFTFTFDEYYRDWYCMTENGNTKKINNKFYSNTNDLYLTRADETDATTWAAFMQKTGYADETDATTKMRIMNAYYYTYLGAKYRVDLIGTTLDGEKAVISSLEVTEPTLLDEYTKNYKVGTKDVSAKYERYNYQAVFTDTEEIWNNYSAFSIRVMRYGELNSITNVAGVSVPTITKVTNKDGATFRLPRYSEFDIHVRMKLNSINNPKAGLHQDNGTFVTDNLVYDVSFGAITNENQLKDLGGYLITAKVIKAGDPDDVADTHYYYVEDVPYNNTPGVTPDTIGLDIDHFMEKGVVQKIANENYIKTGDSRTILLDLSDFNTKDVVQISIKAITRTNAENFENSSEGSATELEIAERLKVPKTTYLTVDGTMGMPNASSVATDVDMETYKKGMAFVYGLDPNYNGTGFTNVKISLAVAIYDNKGDDAGVGKIVSGDYIEEYPITGAWNEGAIETLYAKNSPIKLGYVRDQVATSIDIASFEDYPGQYAGKWMKIAMKSVSDTKIDSKWSDQDAEKEGTINYVWVKIPNLLLDDVSLNVYADPEKDVVRYWNSQDGKLYDEKDQNIQDNAYTEVANQTVTFAEDKNVDSYKITVVDKADETKELFIRRHLAIKDNADSFDGTWDIYINTITGQDENQQDVYEDVLLGRMGTIFEGIVDDTTSADYKPIVDMIDLNEYLKYTYASAHDCEVSMELRYIYNDATKQGSFAVVLPDITKFGDNSYVEVKENDPENDADDVNVFNDQNMFNIKSVTVEPAISTGQSSTYTVGKTGMFERVVDNTLHSWVFSTKLVEDSQAGDANNNDPLDGDSIDEPSNGNVIDDISEKNPSNGFDLDVDSMNATSTDAKVDSETRDSFTDSETK